MACGGWEEKKGEEEEGEGRMKRWSSDTAAAQWLPEPAPGCHEGGAGGFLEQFLQGFTLFLWLC